MLRVHFLNVGHGDCIILESPSRHLSVIDISDRDSLDPDSLKELREELEIGELDYTLAKARGENPFFEKGYDIELTDPITYLTTPGK